MIVGSHNLAYTDEMNSRSNRSVANAACLLAEGSSRPLALEADSNAPAAPAKAKKKKA